MTRQDFGRHGAFALYLSIAALFLAACAGLGGEPRIVATQLPATRAAQVASYPSEPPDIARGAAIFVEHCAECHGPDGSGNGELVVSGQVPAPPDFTDPATGRDQTPAGYFEVITEGRLERLMPPWRDALSEADRWAAAYYVYTLGYSPEQVALGRERYEAACGEQTCDASSLTDQTEAAGLSDAALYALLDGEQDELLPGFDDLSEEERWAVVAHLRTLGLRNAEAIGSAQAPLATPEATELVTSTAVQGRVVNRTEGGDTPADIPVTLFIIDPADPTNREALETTAGPDGRFAFEDVPVDPARSYIAGAVYRERTFTGDLIEGEDLPGAGDLEIPIYELTEDPTVITITAMTTQVDAIGDGLQVLQEVVFENASDRLYTNSLEVGEGIYASVVVGLPPGAVGLAFPDAPNRYVVSQEQQVIVDTIPVRPGQPHVVRFSYFVPYDDGAVIEQPVYYRLDGLVRLFVYPESLVVSSDQLQPEAPQALQSRTYEVLAGELALRAGEAVRYELSGQPVETASQSTPVNADTPLVLIIGLIAEALLIAGLLFWYFRRQQRRAKASDRQARIDTLARQIAELDNQYNAGKIDANVYEARRAQLKRQIARLMEGESDT
ncbi:MAG: c-type cytochrome [Chloroflexota bacterium]